MTVKINTSIPDVHKRPSTAMFWNAHNGLYYKFSKKNGVRSDDACALLFSPSLRRWVARGTFTNGDIRRNLRIQGKDSIFLDVYVK